MKNKINNKLLIVTTTIAAITTSGCTSKSLTITTDTNMNKSVLSPMKKKVSKWKSLKKSKKEDCIDCYASFVKEPIDKVAVASTVSSTKVDGYDYEENLKDSDTSNEVELKEYKNSYESDETLENRNSYLVDASYNEDMRNNENSNKTLYAEVEKHLVREEKSSLMAKNSIQVGAFRKYAGAKVYAKRYSLLTSKYSVNIKENVKENEPIYRVQIEGFSNETEAKEFMNRYGLDGAFLVRR